MSNHSISDRIQAGRSYAVRVVRYLLGRELLLRPQVRLRSERHGLGFAAWPVVPELLSQDSVVYSVGVGTDVSFDLSLIERFGLTVHAFDPTPRSREWVGSQDLPPGFVFHDVGLAATDGSASFRPPADDHHVSYAMTSATNEAGESIQAPVRRLTTLMKELGHDRLDLLKLDIEGGEYEVVDDLLRQSVEVDQLLVEFHHRMPEFGVEKTKQAIARLNDAGYRIFEVAPSGEEYGFIYEGSDRVPAADRRALA